jgi:hypothetical protein
MYSRWRSSCSSMVVDGEAGDGEDVADATAAVVRGGRMGVLGEITVIKRGCCDL